MKTLRILATGLAVFLLTLNTLTLLSAGLANAKEKEIDYYSTAKQHEKNGNYGTAKNDYVTSASQNSNLKLRAKRHVNAFRMYIVSNNFRGSCEAMANVKHNDPTNVIKLLAPYEPQARKALVSSVSSDRSFGYPNEGFRNGDINCFHNYFPNSREALATDFFEAGKKEKGTDGELYWFNLAAENSEKVASRIVKYLMGDVSKLTLQQKAARLKVAGKFMTDYKQKQVFATELLAEGKRLAVIPDKPGEKTFELRTTVSGCVKMS